MSTPRYASPLRYPGGKSQLAPFLVEMLAANGLRRPTLVEPYAGGAGASLLLLFDEYVDRIVINDVDPCILAFWDAAIEHNSKFIAKLRDVGASIAEWNRQRKIYDKRDMRKRFELGFATFYLNRTSRSGIVWNGGPIGGTKQEGKFSVGARFYRETLCDRLARIGRYAHRIDVSGEDGLSLLKGLDKKRDAENAFVFLDPPYYVKGSNLYLNAFDHKQHTLLARYLGEQRRFKWAMTYDNVSEIRALYRNFRCIPFDLSYSAYERRAGQELLICQSRLRVPANVLSALYSAA